jgi:hypothetical protein
MARRRAAAPIDRGERRAETTRGRRLPDRAAGTEGAGKQRAALEKRRAQIEQWIADEPSPIREVELIQQRLDIDAQLAQIDQACRLPELKEAFVKVAASWAKRSRISAAALREVGVPARVLTRAGL